ncbi:MAG: ROK family protein [candidate division KSB1 bacterium]|nr:ROK family protein [candidate division KSB1 bacterium]MDZ7319766.1 ROK family protein [candidate division KSB1 bacterium]MDZ7342235.1 ROK family protein [candidate division KSB1 bacterium]
MSVYAGFDLGGTNLKYALGTSNGDIVYRHSRPSLADQPQAVIFDNMFSAFEELLQEAKARGEQIAAIGVGTPGSIDFPKGQLIGSTPNIPHWTDAPIKKNFEAKFKIPTWADNDANLMALAEARKGAGRKYRTILCLTLGTGIGGGIIIDNQVYRGIHSSAAEVGHIIIEFGGKPCNCGNFGCLEAYASAPAMVERYRRKLKRTGVVYEIEELSTELIFQKAALNEELAKQTIMETCDYLGAGIASMVHIIDPEIVIIGGGVADAGQEFIDRIQAVTKSVVLKPIAKSLRVVKAELKNDAGIVGAILLAAENA